MSGLTAELHIHSCLSPCADDDMTPANIAGMAMLAGIRIAALTDHNSSKNCPAFFAACENYGVIPVAGMELSTAEEIHLVCLFPTLEAAMAFDKVVEGYRPPVPNRPKIFGNQILMNEEDEPVGIEEKLLITASALPLDEATALARSYGGAAYPAHIDRESGGILAILGAMPKEPYYPVLEVRDRAITDPLVAENVHRGQRLITASDAHRLYDIGAAVCELPIPEGDAPQVRAALIALLNGLEEDR